jgi:hypothetical protein
VNKILLLCWVTVCFGQTSINTYGIDSMETNIAPHEWKNDDKYTRHYPIYSYCGNVIQQSEAIIVGLGTTNITIKDPSIFSISAPTRIYPMEKGWARDEGVEWYYVMFDQGVTIIQLYNNRRSIKIYNLGAIPYTCIGRIKP